MFEGWHKHSSNNLRISLHSTKKLRETYIEPLPHNVILWFFFITHVSRTWGLFLSIFSSHTWKTRQWWREHENCVQKQLSTPRIVVFLSDNGPWASRSERTDARMYGDNHMEHHGTQPWGDLSAQRWKPSAPWLPVSVFTSSYQSLYFPAQITGNVETQ